MFSSIVGQIVNFATYVILEVGQEIKALPVQVK